MDLSRHTAHSLDTGVIRDAWIECTCTHMGAAAAEVARPLGDAAAVRHVYKGTNEWLKLSEAGSAPSLGGAHDLAALAIGARKGEVLDAPDLIAVGRTLDVMERVARALLAPEIADTVPVLSDLAGQIRVDPGLLFDLVAAFEPDGRLSARSYPELGDLRRAIQSLHGQLRETLTQMAKGEELADDLQDTFWTVRNDRYVLPLKPHAKRMGVVHGTSGSGRTVFVEPHAILEMNNRLRLTEGRLAAEERRILALLSRGVAAAADEILASQQIMVELDGLASRAELARRLDARTVTVGENSRIALRSARHPVLVLRGIDVIGHDLGLNADQPALVLTGPNTGGKTVALKTLGLCAWMVQHGLPLPVEEDSQFDYFTEIVADVGDAQTVVDDLSSFSAQLVAVRGMLEIAGPRTLVLLDELASGTDPSQGAALAQSVLETLVERGARIVTTTHYPPLKGLPNVDTRFAVAAMEVRDGKPTYALLQGATGESHALATAERMGLAPELLTRARQLLESSDKGLTRTLEALEEQRAALAAENDRIRTARAELDAQRAAFDRRTQTLNARSQELEREGAAAFLTRLKKAEKAIGAVVAGLQANPNQKAAKAARHSIEAFRHLVPEPEVEAPPPAPRAFEVGDRVRHPTLGAGVIEEVGRTIRVRGRALSYNAKPAELEWVGGAPPRSKRPKLPPPPPPRDIELADALRIPGNTVDLRGMRVDEALQAVDLGLDNAVASGMDIVFVLHGHGTGALKTAVREALRGHPVAKRYAPANADQGGDAYTVVAVTSS